MKPRELYYFLGSCLVLDEAQGKHQEVQEVLCQPSFPREQFVRMASSHLVLPAIYTRFEESALLPFLPEDLRAYLQEIHKLNVGRNEMLLKQINWIDQLLRQSDITGIFLKGSGALLDTLYSDPGERILSDIDFLVPSGDFEKTVNLVLAEGYTHRPFRPESLPMLHHFPSLYKASEPARIEIHRYPVGRRQMKFIELEEMINRSAFPEGSDGPMILSGKDQLMINLLHSQMKDRGQYYANVSLRSVYEFHKLTCKHGLPEISDLHPRLSIILNNYMAVAQKLFIPDPAYPVPYRVRTKMFMIRFNLNKSCRPYHRFSKLMRSLADLCYSYLYLITKALIKKEYRRYLGARLSDPSWYGHHVAVLKKRFQSSS